MGVHARHLLSIQLRHALGKFGSKWKAFFPLRARRPLEIYRIEPTWPDHQKNHAGALLLLHCCQPHFDLHLANSAQSGRSSSFIWKRRPLDLYGFQPTGSGWQKNHAANCTLLFPNSQLSVRMCTWHILLKMEGLIPVSGNHDLLTYAELSQLGSIGKRTTQEHARCSGVFGCSLCSLSVTLRHALGKFCSKWKVFLPYLETSTTGPKQNRANRQKNIAGARHCSVCVGG